MAAVVGGVEEEASRMRAQTCDLQDIDQVGMEEMRQQDEGRRLREWMEVSDDPVMVADGKAGLRVLAYELSGKLQSLEQQDQAGRDRVSPKAQVHLVSCRSWGPANPDLSPCSAGAGCAVPWYTGCWLWATVASHLCLPCWCWPGL